jgi:hypothetical protein
MPPSSLLVFSYGNIPVPDVCVAMLVLSQEPVLVRLGVQLGPAGCVGVLLY